MRHSTMLEHSHSATALPIAPRSAVARPGQPFRWSTDAYEPRMAYAAWVHLFRNRFHEIEADSWRGERPFRARLEQHALGNATVQFVEISQGRRIHRTRALIAASRHHDFVLFQLRAGEVRFGLPSGHLNVRRPGECVLVNTNEPYEMECVQPTSSVTLTFPAPWLSRWLPHAEHAPALFSNAGGWSGALCSVVGTLQPDSVSQLTLPGTALAENIATLLALAAGPEAQRARPSLLESLMCTLRYSLHEHDLSPMLLAERHHVSLRTLHYAFASARTTFTEELTRLRLELAREILSDALSSELTITGVATRCGFSDPSHFARRFRRHFGQTPLKFRSRAFHPRPALTRNSRALAKPAGGWRET